MTEMQEMVARAIAGICNDKGQELASKCEMQAPAIPWQAFEREAKAAIEAHDKALEEQGLVIVPKQKRDYNETQSAFSVLRERFFGKP